MRWFVKIAARLGTGLCIMLLVWSCATVPGLKDEEPGSFIRVPFVRVLLGENEEEAGFSAPKAFAVECLTGGQQAVYYSSRPVTVRSQGSFLTVVSNTGTTIQDNVDEVNIIPRGSGNYINLYGKPYRGITQVLPYGRNVQLINIVYMEDYLRGVVPPEIGKRTKNELEAVKAQAVAARTYALSHLQQYPSERYDMKASIYDQVYEGTKVENSVANRAIDETAGNVIMYEDKMIEAYYHSTCGGATDDIAHVWDRKSIPYLKAVTDDGACSWSKYYNWKEHFTEKQLRGRIEQYMASDRGRDMRIGEIRDITIGERTPGNRIAKLTIHTDNDNYRFFRDRIRWVIGRTSNPDLILPSDRFDVIITRDGAGSIQNITFQGQGYGHGVGMCQCGAIGKARQGELFGDILRHYYQGTEIRKLY
ncbi:MAG: SpoIID/LytB domain-containing protein [candidate division Zixibacteria bacterium]|nr:SpoIID/LytB domain-containing protein [candidate division Zixibacteria bacterium]